MPTFLTLLPAIALLAAASADRWNIDQSEPIAPAVGVVKLGAANSANAWFSVRPQSNALAWTLTPFLPATNNTVTHGTVASPGVDNWIPYAVAINDTGLAAVTAAAVDSTGKHDYVIIVIDTSRSVSSIIRLETFYARGPKVDSKNRIWVVGVHINEQRKEAPGDFPLVRVYSQSGTEITRALPRSLVGEPTAQRATGNSFTELLGDDFLVRSRGHQQLHRLRLDESTKSIRVSTFDGPSLLDGPNSYPTRAAECGSTLLLHWRGTQGGAGFHQQTPQGWTPAEVLETSRKMPFDSFAGCTADGRHKALSATGNLLTLSPPQ
jgi:hypothetical protein